MDRDQIIKFLIIIGIAGILGGGIFGFLIALIILGLIYEPAFFAFLSILLFPFFVWSIFKNLWQRKWFISIRRIFQILIISSFGTAMFSLDQQSIPFSNFDYWTVYICLAFTISLSTFLMVLSEYYPKSRIYRQIKSLVYVIQISSLISEFDSEKKK
ncbi:MAG: hypothetical protein AAB336_12685 [Acidobacteriota bacterium]